MASGKSMEAEKEDLSKVLEEDKRAVELTDTQKARIEKNRQRAILLRQARYEKNLNVLCSVVYRTGGIYQADKVSKLTNQKRFSHGD